VSLTINKSVNNIFFIDPTVKAQRQTDIHSSQEKNNGIYLLIFKLFMSKSFLNFKQL